MIPPPPKPRILLGVSGSVAAYKSIELIRYLKAFAEVRVVLTAAGSRLVPERELRQASGHPVWTSLFKGSKPIAPGTPSGSHPRAVVPHIEYAKAADLVLVAPASADFLAKLARGLADDLLSTLCLYATCPIWAAPAMNTKMWNNAAVRRNRELLRKQGVVFLGPDSGHLACGEVGDGRFAEPSEIAFQVEGHFRHFGEWKGKKVLVTAGPTQEPLDPVRVLTNLSSGKMGYALAQAALNRGAHVTLVSGPTRLSPPAVLKWIGVQTAEEMRRQVMRVFPQSDVLVMAAAVADYRPSRYAPSKIKKEDGSLVLHLKKNPDILSEALRRRKPRQVVIGFSAETENLKRNALEKWRKKPCDLLVANKVGGPGSGIESDLNELLVFRRGSAEPVLLKRDLKNRLADKLLDMVEFP